MSITDELRAYAKGYELYVNHKLLAIADRIDERHGEELDEAYEKGVADGIDAEKREGWVKLPVDADGVPIHMGDEMELTDEAAQRWDGDKHFGKVMGLELTSDGWTVEGDPATDLRHVQPDSWIRIIGDAMSFDGDGWYSTRDDAMAELVERCRRLAGEAE